MSASSHSEQSTKDLFLATLDIPNKEDREEFLRQQCAGDNSLYLRIKQLLKAEANHDDLLGGDDLSTLEEIRGEVVEEIQAETQFLMLLEQEEIRIIGDYELGKELGRGAMGVVFEARQRSLKRTVALKLVIGSALASPEERQRFQLEAETAANLDHPNIVPVYEVGQHEGHDYYSMRLIPGGTLTNHLNQLHTDPRKTVQLMIKVIRAIHWAHCRGVLHRDVKPDNILIDQNLEPLVSDFGLARRLDSDHTFTHSGHLMGTPQYMSPEQALGGRIPVTISSDIYSLGAVLYQCLTGQPVFKADSIITLVKLVEKAVPKPLHTLNKQVDRDLETIVMKCLEKSPGKRYSSAEALGDDLTRWLEGRPISARRPSTAERVVKWVHRRPLHAALAGLALLFLLTLGVGGPIMAYRQSELRKQAQAATLLSDQRADKNRHLLYYANMNQAGMAIARPGAAPVLNNYLDPWNASSDEPDLRKWEWYFLSAYTDQASLSIPGNGHAISALSIHPSGNMIAYVCKNLPSILLKNLQTGEALKTFSCDPKIHLIAWHPDGKRLLSVAQSTLTLWNADTGKVIVTVKEDRLNSSAVTYAEWSPDGSRLGTVGSGEFALIRDVDSFEILDQISLKKISDPTGKVKDGKHHAYRFFRWSPDGQSLATVGLPRKGKSRIYVKSLANPDQPALAVGEHQHIISGITWSPDGSSIASSGYDKVINIWDPERTNPSTMIKGHTGWVSAIAWHPDGSRILSGTVNREIKSWNAETHTDQYEKLSGHTEAITTLEISPDGQTLVTGDASGAIKVWRSGRLLNSRILYQDDTEKFKSLAWSPDGSFIASTSQHGTTIVIDAITGERIDAGTFPKLRKPNAAAVRWTPDGSSLTLHTQNRLLSIVDPITGEISGEYEIPSQKKHTSGIMSAEWSSDGLRLAACTYFGELSIWEGPHKKIFRPEGLINYFTLSWSPDNTRLLTSGPKSTVTLWDSATGESETYTREGTNRDQYVGHAWHPDGTLFATGNQNSAITIWNALTFEIERVLTGHTSGATALAWHPDGARLATGSSDHTIRIWDTESGASTLTLHGHHGTVAGLAWNPNGKCLASAGRDGTIRIWDASKAYQK